MATNSPIITEDILKEVSDAKFTRTKRDEAPAHYTLEIESFPSLSEIVSKPPLDRYESTKFQAGDYKWRLILYPGGDKQSDGGGYISLYLNIEEIYDPENKKFDEIQDAKRPKWEVDVLLKFFVFIHTENKFECIQDGRLKRYNAVNKEWGFPKLLLLTEFNDHKKGYLSKEGKCKFGVEVFVVKSEGKGECFSIEDKPSKNLYSWKANLPQPKPGHLFSDQFTLAGYNWKLHLYPEGVGKAKKQYLSIFLWLQDNQKLPYGSKMYVEFKIRIICPNEPKKRKERSGTAWYAASDTKWGFPYFIKVADLKDYTRSDSIQFEAEISSISNTTPLFPDSK